MKLNEALRKTHTGSHNKKFSESEVEGGREGRRTEEMETLLSLIEKKGTNNATRITD